ncbi:protein argonaute-1-like [Centruroides sculpturatus]|nr:protein argonaute-1-like [Centruroides sculpturatus]
MYPVGQPPGPPGRSGPPGPPGSQPPRGVPGTMSQPGPSETSLTSTGGASAVQPGSSVSQGAPQMPELPVFICPRRPNIGTEGRVIILRANHFQISMPRGYLHHYDVTITPDKCPRKVNR